MNATASHSHRFGVGAIVGVLSAGVALGVGEIVAAFVRPAASPVIAVGNRFILLTPESVKRWAIRTFQTSDKPVLLLGIYVGITLFAMAVGVLALRRLVYGLAGIAVFGAIGVYSALTANAARGTDVVPTIVGAVAAAVALVLLVRAAGADDEFVEPAGLGPLVSDRRRFLQFGAAAAGLAVLSGFGGRAVQRARFSVEKIRDKLVLPKPVGAAPAAAANPDLGKSGVPWQTPNSQFYRVDTALSVPQIDPKNWRLRIHGMVDRPMTLTYQQLLARPQIERWITLCCVSNEVGGGLIGNARFLGTRLADLLREAGVQPGADQLVLSSDDGMTIGTPTAVVMDGRDSLLAVGMNGAPLPINHGFPVRTVVPGLYGYVSACKWIVDIEATTFSKRRAYWVDGGWAAQTDIKLESRIDTPRSGQSVAAGKPTAIAGVAWDQHVGVAKVQVQVGTGEWTDARLAPVPSTDTWRQWVLAWTPPGPGSYVVKVRAVDARGDVQTAQVAQPFPSGATGLHTITVRAS
ncbi:MAG: molybdopterin-dependent oxidoreductase [Jatrophihabitantaceae bacterium]